MFSIACQGKTWAGFHLICFDGKYGKWVWFSPPLSQYHQFLKAYIWDKGVFSGFFAILGGFFSLEINDLGQPRQTPINTDLRNRFGGQRACAVARQCECEVVFLWLRAS